MFSGTDGHPAAALGKAMQSRGTSAVIGKQQPEEATEEQVIELEVNMALGEGRGLGVQYPTLPCKRSYQEF